MLLKSCIFDFSSKNTSKLIFHGIADAVDAAPRDKASTCRCCCCCCRADAEQLKLDAARCLQCRRNAYVSWWKSRESDSLQQLGLLLYAFCTWRPEIFFAGLSVRRRTAVMATFDALYVLTLLISASFKLIDANNVCYVEESGCKFRVTILPMSSCPANKVNDQPHITKVTIRSVCLCEIFRYWRNNAKTKL